MKKRKTSMKEKGITLIALIVIIIVLLILVGVTIGQVTGNNGIIKRTHDTTKKYKEASENEQSFLNKAEKEINKYMPGSNTIDQTPGTLDGDGTESNPYMIQSIEDLVALSYNVNSGTNTYSGKTIALGRSLYFDGSYNSYANPNAKYEVKTATSRQGATYDIGYTPSESASKTIKELVTTDAGFIPISAVEEDGKTFEGNFDGKGRSLVGLYEKADNFGGVFGAITSPIKISNLVIKNANIRGKLPTGGIVGWDVSSDGIKISSCINDAGTITGGTAPTGGIIGYVGTATVTDCYNTGTITGGSGSAGGIIGYGNTANAINCYNTGAVTTKGDSTPIGGIIGFGNTANATNCYNTGTITGGSAPTGGIIGFVSDTIDATNCYNMGAVTGGSEPTGGIIGDGNTANATNCYNTGAVTGGSKATGGIIGFGYTANAINCYNIGNVTSESFTGGIIGNGTSATNCYNTGTITGGSAPTGGIIGNGTSATNCYNIGNVTGKDLTGGIIGSGTSTTNCYNSGTIMGSSIPTGGIIGNGSNATNCHNIGDIKMSTPNANYMYEISRGADNTCTYLTKTGGNAQPENAVGKIENEMQQIMDISKFVNIMNQYVYNNNASEQNTKLHRWILKDNMPVFEN